MSNRLKRMDFLSLKTTKREQRMNKALDRIYNRKVSEISKSRAVQYATSAFIMAMHELYGWSSVRSGRAISSAMDKWGSFTKADEHKLLAAAKSIGVLWGFRDADELLSCGADLLAEKPADILKALNI